MSIEFRFSPNVAVQVRDRGRAVAFYRDVLGFEVLKEGKSETKMRMGPMTFFVEGVDARGDTSNAAAASNAGSAGRAERASAAPAAPAGGRPGTTFWEFEVNDFDAARSALVAAGCRETQRDASTSAMFADPFGLRFHVFQTGTELPDCP